VDFSRITESLFIGTTPGGEDYKTLRQLGVGLVINMRFDLRPARDLHQPPMRTLWLRTFDTPLLPIPVRALLHGVREACQVIGTGAKVYTHCARGRHRGVAMGAAILIAQGMDPQQAMDLIREKRPAADPQAGHIHRQVLRFATAWQRINRNDTQ
jgi:protein tyrosine phosphatase (PTP) superfamily phosphohydrolase (DUF442 family)